MKRLALPSLPQLRDSAKLPGFQLTFYCAHRSFRAYVRARNVQAASHEGLIELAAQCPDFDPDNARLVAAVQC